MKQNQLNLIPEELRIIYKLLKDYEEKAQDDEEGHYNDYYDEYEEILDKKQIKSLLKKIGKNLPPKITIEIGKDFLRKKYHTFNNSINERVYAILKKSFETLKTVEIEYFNMESAEFIKRKIDVYYTSAKYTIGYCHLRKAIRKFRTSRISSAKLTESTYKIPKNFNKNDY